MQTDTATQHKRFGAHEVACLALVVLPPLMVLALLAYGKAHAISAESQLQSRLADLRRDGRPTTDAELTVAFDARNRRENFSEWNDALLATAGLNERYFPAIMSVEEDYGQLFGPGESWNAAPIVEQYATAAAPIIDAIEELIGDEAQPVWSPVLFDGVSTILSDFQEAHAVFRLLRDDFRVAIYLREPERALRALRLMDGLTRVYDWNAFLVGGVLQSAHVGMLRAAIDGSLKLDIWDPDHLEQLRGYVDHPEDLDTRWRDMFDSEFGSSSGEFITSELRSNVFGVHSDLELFPFGLASEFKLAYLERFQNVAELTGAGTNRHVRMAEETLAETSETPGAFGTTIVGVPLAHGDFFGDLLFPAFHQSAFVLVRREFERRLTLTAIAVKQFQQQNDRWPTELNELSQVGLSAGDWSVEPSKPIGYQISDDGSEAVLWADAHAGQITIPPWPLDDIDDLNLSVVRVR